MERNETWQESVLLLHSVPRIVALINVHANSGAHALRQFFAAQVEF